MQYNAIQCNIMQYNAIQCNTMQYNQCNTILNNKEIYSTIQYNCILRPLSSTNVTTNDLWKFWVRYTVIVNKQILLSGSSFHYYISSIIQSHTYKIFLVPFPVIFDFFDVELYVVYISIELLKVQDRSLLVRTSLRLRFN